jgi:hypothetical protein
MIVREKHSREEWSYPLELEQVPDGRWCIHVPELLETDEMPTRNLARRHTGNWNLVPPGDDTEYEFIPEDDKERQTLSEYGFKISETAVE